MWTPYNDIKSFLYAWLGKKSLIPKYDISSHINTKKILSFTCELSAPGIPITSTALGSSKKLAMSMAAENFCSELIKNGLLDEHTLTTALPNVHLNKLHDQNQSLPTNHDCDMAPIDALLRDFTKSTKPKQKNCKQSKNNHSIDQPNKFETVTSLQIENSIEDIPLTEEIKMARTKLNEYFVRMNYKPLDLYTSEMTGPSHKPTFSSRIAFVEPQTNMPVETTCLGPTKQIAMSRCAYQAILQLKKMDIDVYCLDDGESNENSICTIKVSNQLQLRLSILNDYAEACKSSQSLYVSLEQNIIDIIKWDHITPNWNTWNALPLTQEHCFFKKSLSEISAEIFSSRNLHSSKIPKELLQEKTSLPIVAWRQEILNMSFHNPVVLIQGQTGCGKSTQVAQYILDSLIDKSAGALCNILVTEPRRLATIAISERIARERGEILGQTTGFRIRFDHVLPRPYGSILICTVGCVLRQLKFGLKGISHIIIDEAHENDSNSHVLMSLLKSMLREYPQLRVIIMSASLDTSKISQYFNNAPVLIIPGKLHEITEYFLDDIERIIPTSNTTLMFKEDQFFNLFANEQIVNSNYGDYQNYNFAISKHSISYFQLKNLLYHVHNTTKPSSILLFLSGWSMISLVFDELLKDPLFGSDQYELVRLHSQLPMSSLSNVFNAIPIGKRRIILSTNIAESSITVKDVDVVIDTCTTKLFRTFGDLNISTFITTWASKSQLEQRKGRTGRTKEGACYRLISKEVYQRIPMHHAPEILSSDLQEIFLHLKSLNLRDPARILMNLLDSPSEFAINSCIKILIDIGALDANSNLTAIGKVIAYFPLTPILGRLILIGHLLGVAEAIAIIASTLSFKEPYNKNSLIGKFHNANDHLVYGDHWIMYTFVKDYEAACARSAYFAKLWCMKMNVTEGKFQNIIKSKDQILNILASHTNSMVADLLPPVNQNEIMDLVSATLCCGFGHNVCVHMKKRQFKYQNEILRSHSLSTSLHASNEQLNTRPYYIFSERLKIGTLVAKGLTSVTPLHILSLTNGNLTIHQSEKYDNLPNMTISYDNWLHFNVGTDVLQSCLEIRYLITDLLYSVCSIWTKPSILSKQRYFQPHTEEDRLNRIERKLTLFPISQFRVCLAMMNETCGTNVAYSSKNNLRKSDKLRSHSDQNVTASKSTEDSVLMRNLYHSSMRSISPCSIESSNDNPMGCLQSNELSKFSNIGVLSNSSDNAMMNMRTESPMELCESEDNVFPKHNSLNQLRLNRLSLKRKRSS